MSHDGKVGTLISSPSSIEFQQNYVFLPGFDLQAFFLLFIAF